MSQAPAQKVDSPIETSLKIGRTTKNHRFFQLFFVFQGAFIYLVGAPTLARGASMGQGRQYEVGPWPQWPPPLVPPVSIMEH